MPTIPGSLIISLRAGWQDADGNPCAFFKLYTYIAGTTTPRDTFSDSDLDPAHANTNPVILDAAGRAIVYLEPGGYKLALHDADDVLVWTQDEIEDIGATLFNDLGVTLTAGSGGGNVSGYTVLSTDNLVEMSSTGGASPCVVNLQPAADRTFPLFVKNLGTVALELRPNGSDTIDGQSTYAVAAASSPTFPCVFLLSDGVSAYKVVSKL